MCFLLCLSLTDSLLLKMKFEQDLCKLRTHERTSRSYFGKLNSTLGSVVPLAMFSSILWACCLSVLKIEKRICVACKILQFLRKLWMRARNAFALNHFPIQCRPCFRPPTLVQQHSLSSKPKPRVLISGEWGVRHGNELGATRKFRSAWLGFVPRHISHHSLSSAKMLLRTPFFLTWQAWRNYNHWRQNIFLHVFHQLFSVGVLLSKK